MSLTVYKNAAILDGTKEMTLQKNKAIVVENDKIKEIVDCDQIPANAAVVDLGGRYVLPGLINLHVHLPGSGKPMNISKTNSDTSGLANTLLRNKPGRWILKKMCYNFAKTELLSGVTTIRTVGGLDTIDSQIRDEIRSGKVVGPNILAADKAISVPGGHMAGLLAYAATSPEEAVACVDKIAEAKPDLIKVMITGGVLDADDTGAPGAMKMPEPVIKAICDRAHALGFYVAAHVESPEGVKAALQNGVDTIEHGAVLDDELTALFHEKNAKLVCTISPAIPMKLLDEDAMPDERYKINGTIVCNGIISAAKTARENDIPVGLGNDVGCPYVTHYDFWRELIYFQKYIGADARETLHTATLKNAQIVGIDHLTGSIEPGKLADMIILDKNPLDDLSVLRNVSMVIKSGKEVKGKPKKSAKIDALLDGMKVE